jgi:chorismate mutase
MSLDAIRGAIAEIDRQIVGLIAQRQQLSGRLAPFKQNLGIPIHDEVQKNMVLQRMMDLAAESQIDPVRVKEIFETLIEMSEERQRECSGEGNLP